MAALQLFRVLLPLAVLSSHIEILSASLREENQQVDGVTNLLLREPETGQEKKPFSCFEDDRRFNPIIERDTWDEKKNALFTFLPVDYVVVRDGGKQCQTHAECLASLSSELKNTSNSVCRTLDNFYIGGDGEVYEGRGWHVAPYWHLNGMRRKAVTVKFLGNYWSEGPSERVMRAFWRMAKTGVWEAKLSPDYKVLSVGQVLNDTTLVGNALEKVFQESSVGMKEFSLTATWQTTPDKTLPLITREEWGAKKPTKPVAKMGSNVKYVMLNEGGERCFTPEECTSRIKAEQEQQQSLYGDLVDNFYIGDDGYVYEGRGFSHKPLWDAEIEKEKQLFKPESMTVRFFGNFRSDLPSEEAIGGLKLLVNAGVSMNRIPHDYKLYSMRGVFSDSRFLGDRLFQTVRKWTPWAAELDDRFAKEPVDVEGFIGLVNRKDWGEKDSKEKHGKIKHPVDYVIINEHSGFDRCVSSKECMSVMKEIQGKEQEEYGDVRDNFYISDIGIIYEGRGWDIEPHFQTKYFNRSLITVNFIGDHQKNRASLIALAAFDKLIRVGVELGKIARGCHFYSSRDVYEAVSFLGDELKKQFQKNEKWAKELETMTENELFESGLLPIVPNTKWSDTSVKVAYADPIRYVVVGNIGDRCYTHDACESVMAKHYRASKKGLLHNFYVGDDGMAYEGRGWLFAPSSYFKGFKSRFYFVTFLGNYGNESRPSDLSVHAFNRLLENGVRTQKLSKDFKIISVHQIFEIGTAPEDHLYDTIKTWERWTSDFSAVPDVEDTSSRNTVFVSRADWRAKNPVFPIRKVETTLSYVAFHNVGYHCIDFTSCILSVKSVQKNTPPRYWDVADNFYVGGDGRIYEGRGWHHSSLWATKGIENNLLSVGFLGTSESIAPSSKALLAFHILQETGIITGRLTPDFKLSSLGGIIKENVVVTETLIGALNATDHWSDDFDLKYDLARLRSLTSPFVLSDEWNFSKLPITMDSKLTKPLEYILIRDGGPSCDTNETCITRINKEHEDRRASSDSGVGENFYVGNDGNVYEGVGWDWGTDRSHGKWRTTITVKFFGRYDNCLPSAKAIEAFSAVIIRDGVATDKLSPDYKIVTIPESGGRTLGSALREEIMTWKNAIPEID